MVSRARPFRLVVVLIGLSRGVIVPTEKDAFTEFQTGKLSPGYQPFNAFADSLDAFLPIINLGMKDRWMLDPNLKPRTKALAGFPLVIVWALVSRGLLVGASGAFVDQAKHSVYLWVHLLLGWVLITLFVAGFTGIVQR